MTKTFFVVVDTDAFRFGVAKLLAEVQRIKSEGDYAAAKELFETYGVHFDPEMRDEVVARVDHLNLPSYTGFVMPKLEPVTDGSGATIDVKISYPCDLTTQMLEYSQSPCTTSSRWTPQSCQAPTVLKRFGFCRSRVLSSDVGSARSLQERVLQAEDARPTTEAGLAPLNEALKGNGRRTAIRAIGRFERPR